MDEKFDLEGELRAGRSRPRGEFADALAGEVRGATGRARQSRIGLWIAMTGLVIVSVASFGGISYAATQKDRNAANAQYDEYTVPSTTTQTTTTQTTTTQPQPIAQQQQQTTQTTTRSELPQSATFSPPKAVAKTTTTKPTVVEPATETTPVAPAPTVVHSGQLPFTGLALWIPLAAGLALIALGVTVRTRAKRRNSPAH